MRTVLHIFEADHQTLAQPLMKEQAILPDCKVEQFDLSKPDVDYGELLEKIFSADAVAVW